MKKTYKLFALLSLLNVGVSMAQNLAKPYTHTPSNGAKDVELKPTFQWNKVNAATSYQLKMYKSDSTLVLDSLLQDTTFKAPTLEENSHYSWIIRALSGTDFSDYTTTSSFTTRSLVAQATPTAISPIGSISKGVYSYQTFSFSAVTIASNYHIQVATDSLFKMKVINDSSLTYNNYSSFNIQDNTHYFWRIAASNSYGKSEFSDTKSFIIPNQITIPEPRPDSVIFYSPKYGSTNVGVNPTVLWSKVKNASYYTFELSDSIANIILNDTLSSLDTLKILANLKYNHIYKVIVTVFDQNNVKGGITHLWFNTGDVLSIPSKPVFVKKTSNGNSLTYQYTVDSNTKSVKVQWSDSRSFSFAYDSDTTAPLSVVSIFASSNLVMNKWYYVKVIAKNSMGASEALIDSVYNTLQNPGSFRILSPSDTQSNVTLTPTFKWSASKWASTYDISIYSIDSAATLIYSKMLFSDTSFVLPEGYLLANKSYELVVDANNGSGTTKIQSSFNTIETHAPVSPILVTSKDTIFLGNTNPVLKWIPVSDATSYCIQVAKDSSFTQLITNACNVTATSYTVKSDTLVSGRMEGTSDKTYFWRIAATNASGQGAWSSANTYSISVVTANEESRLVSTAVSVYPNPVVDVLTINSEIVSVNVKNTSGAVVIESNSNIIDMTNVSNGLYLVEFKTKAGFKQVVKVVKGQ